MIFVLRESKNTTYREDLVRMDLYTCYPIWLLTSSKIDDIFKGNDEVRMSWYKFMIMKANIKQTK